VFLDTFIARNLSGWDKDMEKIISHLRLGHIYCHLEKNYGLGCCLIEQRYLYQKSGNIMGIQTQG